MFDRLSREEKFNKALEKAMTESKTSGPAGETTPIQLEKETSCSSEHAQDTSKDEVCTPCVLPNEKGKKDKDFDSKDKDFSPEEEDDDESDNFSPEQTLDSDDDFQPNAAKSSKYKAKAVSSDSSKVKKVQARGKTKKTSRKIMGKGVATSGTKAEEASPVLVLGATSIVQKAQLPGAKKSTPALSRQEGKTRTTSLSASCESSPSASNVGVSVKTGRVPIRTSGGPVIRVGLSRKAPVKQLHKPANIS